MSNNIQLQAVENDTASVSTERLRLWLQLLATTRSIENEIRERFRIEFDTTLPRFDVLAALDRHPDGLKMSHLSSALRVSNGNITGIVQRLIEDGLVASFSVKGDRRASLIRLTGAGKKLFDMQAKAHESWVNGLLSEFDSAGARQLIAHLQPVVTNLQEKK